MAPPAPHIRLSPGYAISRLVKGQSRSASAGRAGHRSLVLTAGSLSLDETDRRALRAVLDDGPSVAGDVYDLERVKGSRHEATMKCDLNSAARCWRLAASRMAATCGRWCI